MIQSALFIQFGKATQVNSNTTISLALEPVKSITFSETKVS
ncbi:MAG: hypothetical protein R2744_12565 [Bacteroidales bacterium]